MTIITVPPLNYIVRNQNFSQIYSLLTFCLDDYCYSPKYYYYSSCRNQTFLKFTLYLHFCLNIAMLKDFCT